MNDRYGELDEVLEERLEHFGSSLGKIDEGNKGLAEVVGVLRVLDGWEDVEDVGDEVVVFGLGLFAEGPEEGGKSLHGGKADQNGLIREASVESLENHLFVLLLDNSGSGSEDAVSVLSLFGFSGLAELEEGAE